MRDIEEIMAESQFMQDRRSEQDENTDLAISALRKLGIDWLVSAPAMKQKKLDALNGMLANLESRQMYEDCAFVKSAIDRVSAFN